MSLSCKKCGCANYVKNGFVHENQRYLCKNCGYRFTDTPGHGYPISIRFNAAILYLCGTSITCAPYLLGVAPSTVQAWLEWVAAEHPPKAVPNGTVVVIELDEMWHYLNSKEEKLWIWKALNRFRASRRAWKRRSRTLSAMSEDAAVVTDLNRRPGTLAEVVRRVRAGQQTLSVALSEFLDEFYMDTDKASRGARIQECPAFLDDAILDTYIGAVGEHLARRWDLGDPPAWTEDLIRFLHRPWFPPGVEAEKPFLLVESPSAFRRRLMFVEAEPLRQARMPQDERWWAYETLRTGLLPPDPDSTCHST